MLPILRIIPVGGVFLAIAILVLALAPPGGTHHPLASSATMARGALIDRADHPEWQQSLIRAAFRRADELNRLRDLPDTPVRSLPVIEEMPVDIALPGHAQDKTAPDAPQVAGLPAERSDADPEDVTGSISELPGATIPVDIGETSSTELPVIQRDERPPVIRKPERMKPLHDSRRKPSYRVRRAKAPPKPPAPVTFNLFEALFGSLRTQPPVSDRQAATLRAGQH
jgi:hypothetical protein